MLSALLAGALIAAASLFLGAAVMALAGRPRHSPAVPAAGLSVLLVVCGIAIKLPGHGTTAAIAAGLALIAAAVVLGRSREPVGTVRIGAVLAVAGAALVIAIPFVASGRIGILGQGLINDDMASHLLFTEWADTRAEPTPDLVEDGYPLGPHAIVSATSKVVPGADLIETFAGLTGAIAILAALTAYGALGGVRGLFRVPASVLAALPYLGAAWLAQGAFKEPMLALSLLGFALCLPSLRESWKGEPPTYVSTLGDRGRGWMKTQARLAIPAGVIAAGTIYNYSFPGLAWLVIAVIAWALLIAYRERDEDEGWRLRQRVRWALPLLVAGVAIPVLAALPEAVNMVKFAGFEAFNPSGEGSNTGFGNLRQPLNPLEAMGIWPSSEFRVTPANSTNPEIAFWLGGLIAVVAFAWGLARAIARREAALPAALISGAVGYLAALAIGTPYTSAKALAVAAPVVMLIVLRGLLRAEPLEDEYRKQASWWPPRRLRPHLRFGVPAFTALFAVAAAFSTYLPLHQAAVGPGNHVAELRQMREVVDGDDVLFLGRDSFISWELLGSEVYTPIRNPYDTEAVWSLYRATDINAKFDWDNVPPALSGDRLALDDFDWVITTRADFNSQPPPEFAPATETQDFVLWKRRAPAGPVEIAGAPAPVSERRTLREPIYPGATLDCTDPKVSELARLGGFASVFPVAPVIGKAWEPGPEITHKGSATEELLLAPGTWNISIQYASTQPMTIEAPGLKREMRTNMLFRGPSPYYPVGQVDVTNGDEPVRFTVTVGEPPLLGRTLGGDGEAYLGRIAATPVAVEGAPPDRGVGGTAAAGPLARQTIPLNRACGRYIDWYGLAPGVPASAAAGVEGPTPEEPDSAE
jgi:hypothetical protein